MFAKLVGVGCAKDDVDDFWKLSHNRRQCVQHIFNAFVGRKQSKRQQNCLAFDAELVLEIGGIDKADVWNPMRDQIDFVERGVINVMQHLASAFGHHHHPRRQRNQLFHDAALVCPRLAQDGVQSGDHRHPQFAQEGQDMAAGGSAENAELVL